MSGDADVPPQELLRSERVPAALAEENARCLSMSTPRVAVLATMAGALVGIGALLSVLLSTGVTSEGPRLLLAGVAFAVGYFFVALASAVLFTEANVVLPDILLEHVQHKHIVRYWSLAFAFNFVGAFAFGLLVHVAQTYSPEVRATLDDIVALKMQYRDAGGFGSWASLVASGMLANMLVGLGFFFALMARSVIGKFLPLALAVVAFEAANFQHSPANMGYFGLVMPTDRGPAWSDVFWWNLVPAGIGNIVGGALFVAVPFWYAFELRGRSQGQGEADEEAPSPCPTSSSAPASQPPGSSLVEMASVVAPRPEHVLAVPRWRSVPGGGRCHGGAGSYMLSCPTDLALDVGDATTCFTVGSGDRVGFALCATAAGEPVPATWSTDQIRAWLYGTIQGWRSWSWLHQRYQGPWAELVHHRGRILKALNYQPAARWGPHRRRRCPNRSTGRTAPTPVCRCCTG